MSIGAFLDRAARPQFGDGSTYRTEVPNDLPSYHMEEPPGLLSLGRDVSSTLPQRAAMVARYLLEVDPAISVRYSNRYPVNPRAGSSAAARLQIAAASARLTRASPPYSPVTVARLSHSR